MYVGNAMRIGIGGLGWKGYQARPWNPGNPNTAMGKMLWNPGHPNSRLALSGLTMDGTGLLGTGLFGRSWGLAEWSIVGVGAYILFHAFLAPNTRLRRAELRKLDEDYWAKRDLIYRKYPRRKVGIAL